MATISIWPGSTSFADTTSPTPFGFYDNDQDFQTNADKVATWCAQRLGYPIVDIELQAVNFFTAFEEAVTTYSQYVYQYKIILKENHRHEALDEIFELLKDYS